MLRKIKTKLFRKEIKNSLIKTIINIKKIRSNNNTIVLYGSPTKGHWLGIANATKSLYPNNSIEIPQEFSNTVFNKKETNTIIEEIKQLNFEKIIISGFASYFFKWIDELYTDVRIKIIYHGTISEFHNIKTKVFISKMISFGDEKKIYHFYFIKKDLDVIFNKMYNFSTSHQPLPSPILPTEIKKIKLDNSKIHIGVFGADTFNKNLHNQVINALLIENTIIHVLDQSIFSYLKMENRIISHGSNLNRREFLSILGSMDLNLHMSFNESWGLIAYESIEMGIPCINSKEIDYLNEIKKIIEIKL